MTELMLPPPIRPDAILPTARSSAHAEAPTANARSSGRTETRTAEVVVQLFGGPRVLQAGSPQEVPEGSKRLLVLVALSEGRVERRKAAGQLWPEVDETRAAGNLRSAHWRLRGAGIDVLSSDGRSLSLATGTVVDVGIWCDWALRVIEGNAGAADLQLESIPHDALDLLPGWYDDWVIFERERIRQRLLHALEALSRQLSACGRHAEAVEAAMTVVAWIPCGTARTGRWSRRTYARATSPRRAGRTGTAARRSGASSALSRRQDCGRACGTRSRRSPCCVRTRSPADFAECASACWLQR